MRTVWSRWLRHGLALCLGGGLAGGLLASERPPREVWISADPVAAGDGRTRDTPRDGSTWQKLEAIFERLYDTEGDYGSGVVIHFLAGHYETSGIHLRPNWWILGDGMGSTVLKRVPTEADRRFLMPNYVVIEGGWGPQWRRGGSAEPLPERDYANLRIADLTLDCNWTGLKGSLGTMVKKAAGLFLIAREVEVARVQVIHFGAQGGRPAWREVFPILVQSSPDFEPETRGYASSVFEIHGCRIVGPVGGPDHALEWPYGMGIAVGNPHVDARNQRVDVRVHHNEFVDLTNGIAFGGAYLTGGVFESNRVLRCYLGFNFDAGLNRDVIIRNNEFIECAGGGTVSNSQDFLIENNVIEILGNVPARRAWGHNGLRIWHYTRRFRILNNEIGFAPGVGPEITGDPHGILLHGEGVGVMWVEASPGRWSPVPQPHVIEGNVLDPRLPNRAGPQSPGNRLYARIDRRDIALSGYAGQEDGTAFEWRAGE